MTWIFGLIALVCIGWASWVWHTKLKHAHGDGQLGLSFLVMLAFIVGTLSAIIWLVLL